MSLVALGVNEDRGSGLSLGFLLQQELRHLRKRVVGVEDVVTGVEFRIPQDPPRAGGWEEERSCYGHHADAPHRAQRLPTTLCHETQTAKRAAESVVDKGLLC